MQKYLVQVSSFPYQLLITFAEFRTDTRIEIVVCFVAYVAALRALVGILGAILLDCAL